MRFLVNGSIAFDILLEHKGSFLTGIRTDALEDLSVNYLAEGYKRHHGGTAANIGWTLALLGHTPVLTAAVGDDAQAYLALLRERGVDTSLVERRYDAVTATAIIATDIANRQMSFFHPGADALATFPDISDQDCSMAIMSPRNPSQILEGIQRCTTYDIPYVFDPGQVVHAFTKEQLLDAIDSSRCLVLNAYEWTLLEKILGMNEKSVAERSSLLVITEGERGLRMITTRESHHIPPCITRNVVNPTGAGDALRAGLLHGLASRWSLEETGRLGAILGCMVVEQEGTLLNALTWEMIQRRAVESYGKELKIDN